MAGSEPERDDAYFTSICIDSCGGRCCDPWWGIVEFTLKKEDALNKLSAFTNEIERQIAAREERIRSKYVTCEEPPRRLFDKPERYNVSMQDVKFSGGAVTVTLRAMFAFRCLFLSEDKACTIHPAVTGGKDIRPPHCGYMGTPNASYGEKGFCRIIHAAAGVGGDDEKVVNEAIALEARSSEAFFSSGAETVRGAAEKVAREISARAEAVKAARAAEKKPPSGESAKRPGRNAPCYCGSGKKFKKCHGA